MLAEAFPNILFDAPPRSIVEIAYSRIGAHQITYIRSGKWTGETSAAQSDALGFGESIKLVWLLSGCMAIEDRDRRVAIKAGEALLARHSSDCLLAGSDDYESLVLRLHPSADPAWRDLVEAGGQELRIGCSSAAAAAHAGFMALLRQTNHDSTSELAVQSLFELVTRSANRGIVKPVSDPVAPSLYRARELIRQNIADPRYTPERLAHDLGLSRRSLYNRFADNGVTPAAFIRMVRLAQARQEIENDPSGATPLTTIALRNGFPDSSSLSHAIKSAYGVSPRALRGRR
ncbi:AraC family transcriptional regulator [Bradyrhizobium sp. SZCCHNR2009]|uniref:AraC family transcriptional regulator n=1 Tax=Bradyrhizobium sp. SZCCHNR2009 TaxID=3057375 RepID=UPI0028E96734|nr:AraC family transcriptional regulator [Bradyrhizobium sp. SZCCHNR2009]